MTPIQMYHRYPYKFFRYWGGMRDIIKKQWFLVSLICVFFVVIFDSSNILAQIGTILKDYRGPEIIIFLVFIISGLLIEASQIQSGIKDIKATFLSLFLIIIGAPVVALILSFLPLETGVIIGLFIVSAMPTTLSSGVVMTGVAGGNMAHALFTTVLSNITGVFTIPIVLSLLTTMVNINQSMVIEKGPIMLKLTLIVLLPLLIGIILKAAFLSVKKTNRLQTINQCLIVLIVFISLSGAKEILLGKGVTLLIIVILVAMFHVFLLMLSFLLTKLFKLGPGRFECVLFMGSQKTLPLSVMIQVTYFSEFGAALVVCVMHHIVHLIIDGYLSTNMKNSKN